jgi:hypothetical protein
MLFAAIAAGRFCLGMSCGVTACQAGAVNAPKALIRNVNRSRTAAVTRLSEPSTAKTAAITVLAASPMVGLAAFEDRMDDIGRQVGKPQNPADMGVVELELSGDLRRVAVFSAAKITNP